MFQTHKQNFGGLVMDNKGNIEVEESDDEYEEKENTKNCLQNMNMRIQPSKKRKKTKMFVDQSNKQ